MKRPKYWIRLLAAFCFICTIIYFIHFKWAISADDIREYILSYGWISPIIFWVIYALGPFIFFPSSILSMAAGLSYGIWPGVLYIWIGASGAAATGYWIGRFFGKSIIKWHAFKWAEPIQEKAGQQGFFYVLVLRLIPLVGFDLLCYISGLTKVRFSHYMAATMIGIIPGATAYGALGSSLLSGNIVSIGIAAGLFILVFGTAYLFRSRVKEWLGINHADK